MDLVHTRPVQVPGTRYYIIYMRIIMQEPVPVYRAGKLAQARPPVAACAGSKGGVKGYTENTMPENICNGDCILGALHLQHMV